MTDRQALIAFFRLRITERRELLGEGWTRATPGLSDFERDKRTIMALREAGEFSAFLDRVRKAAGQS